MATRRLRLYRGRRGESEAALEHWCVGKAKERGWVSRKMNGLGFRDWPDRLFIRPLKLISRHSRQLLPAALSPRRGWTYQRPVWVELKRRGEVPTLNQSVLHKMLRDRGEDVRVIDTKEAFVELLNE